MQAAFNFNWNFMPRLLLSCCLLLAAFGARADVVDIDNAELAKLAASGVPVIDIRTRPEWEETGIVPGSHLLTFFDERGNAGGIGKLASCAVNADGNHCNLAPNFGKVR